MMLSLVFKNRRLGSYILSPQTNYFRHKSDILQKATKFGGISKFKKAPSQSTQIPSNKIKADNKTIGSAKSHVFDFARSRQQQQSPPISQNSSQKTAPEKIVKGKPKPKQVSNKVVDSRVKSLAENIAKRNKNQQAHTKAAAKEKTLKKKNKIPLSIPRYCTVANLAQLMSIKLADLLKKLPELGFDALSPTFILDNETAMLIADEYDFEVQVNTNEGYDVFSQPISEDESKLTPRPPIVTIMGHVDHGKTTILDYMRRSSVVDTEFGGITQHIGAFSFKGRHTNKPITFLDTPGHAAFLKMRERGAIVTDIVVLVVAADDSVKPQTIEAIKHAKKYNVPMIVAINKCDKKDLNIDRVLSDLSSHGVDVEDYGGETQVVRCSALTGLHMENLEEAIITLSDIHEYKTELEGQAEAHIIETKVKKGLGNVATVLPTRGSLTNGTVLVAGTSYCKIVSLKDGLGKPTKKITPSIPTEINGWDQLPEVGDLAIQVKDLTIAKKVIKERLRRLAAKKENEDVEIINKKRLELAEEANKKKQLEELSRLGLSESDLRESAIDDQPKTKTVNYIVKGDVQGSLEAIVESISDLGNEEVKSAVIYAEIGAPTTSDIARAETANAKILCFNVTIPRNISQHAEKSGVELPTYNVIYHLIEDVVKELSSHLKPNIEIRTLGESEIKNIFVITGKRKEQFKIAGCKVSNGTIKRNHKIMVMRKDECIFDGTISTLKQSKDDVLEVKKGTDCGISLTDWSDFEVGDIIKAYEEIETPRYL